VDRAAHLDVWPFDTGDPRMDRALEAMAQAVGEVGYHRATIGRICRSAGVSAGYLYARYENKRAFFLAANDRLLEYRAVRERRLRRTARFSLLVPASPRPSSGASSSAPTSPPSAPWPWRRTGWPATSQQMRQVHDERELALAAQVPQGPGRQAALAYLHSDMAMAFGVDLVPNIVTPIWTLPFDMVTVPLMAGLSV
jgi:AcrR family transcriptional regulator